VTPSPSPVPTQLTPAYRNKIINGYDIVSDGVNETYQWVRGTLPQARTAALSTPGCSAFCYDNANGNYCLKGINLPSRICSKLKEQTNVDTYILDRVSYPCRRVQLDWKAADPFVTYNNGVFYYAYSSSSGKIRINTYTGTEPVENMFSHNNSFMVLDYNDVCNQYGINTNNLPKQGDPQITWAKIWSPKIMYLPTHNVYVLTFTMFTTSENSEIFFISIDGRDIGRIRTRITDPNSPWKWGQRNFVASTSIFKANWYIDSSVYEFDGKYYICASTKGPRITNSKKCDNNDFDFDQYVGIQELNVTYDKVTKILTIGGKSDKSVQLNVFRTGEPYIWEKSSVQRDGTSMLNKYGKEILCKYNDDYFVNEGPFLFKNPNNNNKFTIITNANFYRYSSYCLGQITCKTNDLSFDANDWEKKSLPLSISTRTTCPGKKCYGPGGFSFVNIGTRYFGFYHVTPDYDANGTRVVVFQEFFIDSGGNINLGTPTIPENSPYDYLLRGDPAAGWNTEFYDRN